MNCNEDILSKIIRKTLGMEFTCQHCGAQTYLCQKCGIITTDIIKLHPDFLTQQNSLGNYMLNSKTICPDCADIFYFEHIFKSRVIKEAWDDYMEQMEIFKEKQK